MMNADSCKLILSTYREHEGVAPLPPSASRKPETRGRGRRERDRGKHRQRLLDSY
jgi:hypothetical protein